MARYLSKHRIESPICLEPNDVSFLRTRLSETETKVESLENQISELTRQKDAKLVDIASFRNILAPVRRIPLEILSEIFKLALCLPNENIFWSANYNFARKMQSLNYIPFGRIRLLHLSGNPSSYLPIFQLPSSSLPLLEEVFFDIVDSKGDPVSRLKARLPENMEVLLTAHKLKHVEMRLDDSSILISIIAIILMEYLT
ncbi:hypothetical protein BT96DRAFT_939133 [Gymnopus androsaceus JB14]|uniref:F-box domain-containing protein n=1 Tax=Gymnopus androsaceus JB14 TaxID=1447944 RepID=A0A6A4HNZ3_9AGAR|nr:hypothetical protein BT96DRAFT_939133 [Gymnopus androsaceus JB14]